MIEFFGRLFERPETLRSFDAEEDVHAPDEYVREFVKMQEGSIAFIEVSTDKTGPWALWRVECVGLQALGLLMLLTGRCSEEEAHKELKRLGVS